MSFFQKEQTEKNLQYDDIAFLHFLLTVSIISVIFFGYLIYKRLKSARVTSIKNYRKVQASGIFTKQLQRQAERLKKQKITNEFWVMVGIFVFSIFVSFGLIYFISTHTTQMIGFDPHQILGIKPDATTNQIKKAYRKLALELHPDRNPNNPEAHARFIMVSKSYECLTDEQKKQNCLKFGNPDGQASFQVGIGLPKFLISKQNQFVILPVVFSIFLILIPMIFINWTKGLKTIDAVGFDRQNYGALYPFYRPEATASYGFYLVTALKQLQTDKKLNEKQKDQFLKFLGSKNLVEMKNVNEMTDGQLYILHQLLLQMAQKKPDIELCHQLPDLLNSLMLFSLFFARRGNDKKNLIQGALQINWIGTRHLSLLLQFMRTFYNCSLYNPSYFTEFDYLDIEDKDRQISFKNPVPSLKQLISNKDKIKQHLSLFPQQHRNYLQQQLNDLPILKMDIKIMIDKKTVHQITTQDFPQIYFKVQKMNDTSGYCFLHYFPFLKQQKYYFMLIYGDNLIHFQQVIFQQGKNVYVGKFPYRQGFARQMQFFAFLQSDCRYGLTVQSELKFNVKQLTQEQKGRDIEINKEDQQLQKLPKNGLQKALSLETQSPSDLEMSDTQDDSQGNIQQKQVNGKQRGQKQIRPKQNVRSKKMRMQKQKNSGGCSSDCCEH